jgi:hypothetical protein
VGSVTFDRAPTHISAHFYDLETREAGLCPDQPVPDVHVPRRYVWKTSNVSQDRLYFLLFERPAP